MESRKQMRERHKIELRRTVTKSMLGIIAGTSLAGGLLIFGTINQLRNPYLSSKEVREYKFADRTLLALEFERANLSSGSTPTHFYVPENARGEFEIVYGAGDNSRRVEAIDSYVSKVNAKMEDIRQQPNFKSYQTWNDSHFTADDDNFFPIALSPFLLVGISGFFGLKGILKTRARQFEERGDECLQP